LCSEIGEDLLSAIHRLTTMMTNLQVATALTSPPTPTTAEVVYSSRSATPIASKGRQYAILFKDKISMNETHFVKFHRRSGFSLLLRGVDNAPDSLVYHCSLDHHSMKVAYFFLRFNCDDDPSVFQTKYEDEFSTGLPVCPGVEPLSPPNEPTSEPQTPPPPAQVAY
jgi:hypothetical protein